MTYLQLRANRRRWIDIRADQHKHGHDVWMSTKIIRRYDRRIGFWQRCQHKLNRADQLWRYLLSIPLHERRFAIHQYNQLNAAAKQLIQWMDRP